MATSIVRTEWFNLLNGNEENLRPLLSRIPAHELRSRPLLALLLGLCYISTDFQRLLKTRYFMIAVRSAQENPTDHAAIDLALIRATEATAYRLLGSPELGLAPARHAVRALESIALEDRSKIPHLPRVYCQAGITLYYGGDVDAALETFGMGLAEMAVAAQPASAFGNLSMLAGIHALEGRLPEAKSHVKYARTAVWSSEQRNSYTGTFYGVAEVILALEKFDAASARGRLNAMAHDRRTIEHWTAIARVEALIHLMEGTPGRALAKIDTFSELRGPEGRSRAVRADLSGTRALLQLALGNPLAAEAILRDDLAESPRGRINQARVELCLDRTGSALTALRSITNAHLPARLAAEAAALEAAVMLRISAKPRALGIIDHLGELLRSTQMLLPLALLPAHDHSRVVTALRKAGYAEVLDGSPVRSVLTTSTTGTPLTQRELTVLETFRTVPTVTEVAARLSVSSNTVKSHLRSVYRKFGVSKREDAIAVAISRHLFVDPD
ncbi:hypothetical protein GCM10011490_19350 [Pseudoclavibacter endophyticus]|uniref:LuxR family transcriptional regulator n=1 Tax=Pseudoclavibacter endophyticus TaxID=1778590 RepID=A0A6H9WKH0_9MICO|nr:helix-turn-helix transcriptional regulator [Pseudoclavibacter endophyticus]KAB1648002.1 LuxR family transcriptional regulator [Pseudoclavibacter endophyticus]GGA68957.1 hypothetical protein GCM10011490_19350 [Pseudoclavibacter endophyticus]